MPTPRESAPVREDFRIPPLELSEIDAVVRPALREDLGGGDITSENAIPESTRARGRLVSKSHGRIAGLPVFARAFELIESSVRVELLAREGAEIRPGMELARLDGSARALLAGERTALNLVQRMSGTATMTAQFVERCRGRARILDTRKTTPNLRALEKYAVRCGGGENHRFGLFDEVMVKNNHVDLAGRELVALLQSIRRDVGAAIRITCEARDEQEALAGVAGGADVVMLDNMSTDRMAALCPKLREDARRLGRRIEIEASGGIRLDNVHDVAASGVDRISIGALTHSAPALDLSLYLERAT